MKSTSRYQLEDLEQLAREKTVEMSELAGEEFQLQWPPGTKRKWEFRDWEIDWFLRAYYEHSLFRLEPRLGRNRCPHVGFVGPLMLPSSTGNPYVHEFLVGWEQERPFARLYSQEYLTQFSVAGELVGYYGQPAERLIAELVLVREVAGKIRTGGYAIDLALLDGPRPPQGHGKIVMGAEIKLTRKSHQKLIAAIKKCRGLLPDRLCGSDYRKCLWIRQTPTVRYLWVRSQDESDLFHVVRTPDTGFDLQLVAASQARQILSCQDWGKQNVFYN